MLEGRMHGIGIMKFPNGNTYYGEWSNNKRNGEGV
jgi:hypothetical protein